VYDKEYGFSAFDFHACAEASLRCSVENLTHHTIEKVMRHKLLPMLPILISALPGVLQPPL
jgi:hypothetical protein